MLNKHCHCFILQCYHPSFLHECFWFCSAGSVGSSNWRKILICVLLLTVPTLQIYCRNEDPTTMEWLERMDLFLLNDNNKDKVRLHWRSLTRNCAQNFTQKLSCNNLDQLQIFNLGKHSLILISSSQLAFGPSRSTLCYM